MTPHEGLIVSLPGGGKPAAPTPGAYGVPGSRILAHGGFA
jgi:hypothetical protein